MCSRLAGFLRNAFRDRFRRHLLLSLIILGIVLTVISQPRQPPIIEALEVTKERHEHCYLIQEDISNYKVGREQNYDIECIVLPTNGGLFYKLSYEWECDDGEIEGIGPLVTWTAPNTSADVTVTVTVSDTAGNMVSESVTLNVVSCSPCTFRGC